MAGRGERSQRAGAVPRVTIGGLLEIILDDIMAAGALSHDEWHRSWSDPFTPMAIPTADGRHYPCTQTGADAAHRLTAAAWSDRPDLRQGLTRKAFDLASFRAIGQTISESASRLPESGTGHGELGDDFYAALAGDYRANLDAVSGRVRVDLDRHIACSLFHRDQVVPSFDVGPVAFRPRADWVARYVEPPVLDWVDRVDRGDLTRKELRRRIREESDDAGELDALEILDALGPHAWVATVRIEQHETARSHEKALIIVGLAVDAIGLRFALEDARSFATAGRRDPVNEARLATTMSGAFVRGWSHSRRGIGGRPGALAAKMSAERPFLDAAGVLLGAYLRGRGSGTGVHFVERWANALYWFGEARREASDFMAVVDYGCAADGLSGAGGKVGSMAEFAEAALDPAGTHAASPG